jgi:hypothetical protein
MVHILDGAENADRRPACIVNGRDYFKKNHLSVSGHLNVYFFERPPRDSLFGDLFPSEGLHFAPKINQRKESSALSSLRAVAKELR